jgi:hypothetical protein
MGTRSNIGILNQDGIVDYIYCHYDGYIDHNGKTLNEYYNTEEKVRELISLGDMNALTETIDSSIFYKRDKGEILKIYKTSYVDYTKEYFEEYVYLFTPGQGWEVREYGSSHWTDLNDAINNKMIIQSTIKN